MTKKASEIVGLHEVDMPTDKQKKDPKKLCLEQRMKGKYVGVQWTHYIEEDGVTHPACLEIGHDGKVRPSYRLGLKEAKRWITASDTYIDENKEKFSDIKDWNYE